MKFVLELGAKERRAASMMEDFEWNGALFQVDSESQRFIASKAISILKAQLANTEYGTIRWRTSDNQFYSFTTDEFLEFASAVELHIENILATSWDIIDNGE